MTSLESHSSAATAHLDPSGNARRSRQIVIALIVLLAAGAVFAVLFLTTPKTKRKPPRSQAAWVETSEVHTADETVVISASGTVSAAREVQLYPRVRGEIVYVHPNVVPGGVVPAGATLYRIDSSDYEIAAVQAESQWISANASLKLEQGNQSVAKRELELLGENLDEKGREYVLRKPQLATVTAAEKAAKAAWDKAKLDLARTNITLPFDAIVRKSAVARGSRVSESTPLGSFAAVDTWWIEVALPTDELRWIEIPRDYKEEGSKVRIYNDSVLGKDVYRKGRVLRLAADLEEKGQMARLLVAVDSPLGNKSQPRLILGSWVSVEIEGRALPSVVVLSREWVRDDNTVWVLGENNQLEIRKLTIAHFGRDYVYVTEGLVGGDLVITTNLPAAVEGMKLRVAKERGLAKQDDATSETRTP